MALSRTLVVDFAFEVQFVQRGERDAARIDFEKIAQRLAAFAAAEAVGAERCKPPRQPLADHVGQRLEIIGGRNEHAGRVAERLGDVRHARLRTGMQQIPAFGLDAVGVEVFVAGDAPDVGGDVVFFLREFPAPAALRARSRRCRRVAPCVSLFYFSPRGICTCP